MSDLEARIQRVEQGVPMFAQSLRAALGYIDSDPGSSLTKSRIVMEKLLIEVFTTEMGKDPRKPLLAEMLTDNQFTRKIDRRILARMNSIRDMGNLGPHGEPVEPNDAARVLEDLLTVIEWYMQRYPQSGAVGSPDESTAPAIVTQQNAAKETQVASGSSPVGTCPICSAPHFTTPVTGKPTWFAAY